MGHPIPYGKHIRTCCKIEENLVIELFLRKQRLVGSVGVEYAYFLYSALV